MNGRLASIEKEVKEVKASVEKMETTQSTYEDEVRNLRKDLDEVKNSSGEGSDEISSGVLAEIKDREERKHSVIVLGIKESAATEKTQIHADENQILDKMFSDMAIPTLSSDNLKFKARLGSKEPGKQRPFLLKFHDVRVRDGVLRNSSKITIPGVRVKPDLTKKQREEDERFKQSVDDENRSKPSDESGDYRWKIAGPPGNLRKVKVRNIPEWEEAERTRAARLESRRGSQ